MRLRQYLLLIALTLVYLCCELAFNARLLDVVGGSANSQQIHEIERFGRALSGIAAALFVLQMVMKRRNATQGASPSPQLGAGLVVGTALVVYASLNLLVDTLVNHSTPEFRRVSQSIVLVQGALVQGQVELDGLTDDSALLRQPAGKAFLAQFSWMAASIDRLDDKIRSAKLSLITSRIEERMGGAGGFYGSYQEAVRETEAQWKKYARAGALPDADAEVARQQNKAWTDYVSDLGRRGWTPSTVPRMAQATVRRKVRTRVPVPDDWDVADEATFRRAVESAVRRRLDAAGSARRAAAGGMPTGLSWPAFFAHPTVQEALRKKIQERMQQKMGGGTSPAPRLPANLRLQPSYSSGKAFQDEVFAIIVKSFALQELARYDAPASAFADGAELAQRGKDAARLALVPPIALFFSMLGALLHCTKLLYLLLAIARERMPRWKASRLHPVPIAVGACLLSIGLLATMDNAVTRSRLFTYLHQQVLSSADDTLASQLKYRFIAGSLRVVSVGQDRFYPLFEFIRVHALRGFHFGYEEKTPS